MLPYGRQLIEEDDIEAVAAQLRSDWLTQGPTVARFEEALCQETGAPYAVAVSSGTAALHLACLAAGLQQGESGITSTNTFVASANCMRYVGARPSFADIDPETGLISVASLRSVALELKAQDTPPRVIVPVDFSGSVADLEGVREVAKEFGATVIEDAAHALGGTWQTGRGKRERAGSCTFSEMAILSFHPVKHITTGEGGAILVRDEGAYRRLLELRSHGITKDPARLERNEGGWYYEQQALGFHYRITDVQCALGLSQLKKLGRYVERRRALATRYDTLLRAVPFERFLRPLGVPKGVDSSYHLYVVCLVRRGGESLEDVAGRRRVLYDGLRARGIGSQVHYIPVHRQPDFVRAGLGDQDLPGAQAYYAGCLSLPLFPAMDDGDVERVVAAIAETLDVGA